MGYYDLETCGLSTKYSIYLGMSLLELCVCDFCFFPLNIFLAICLGEAEDFPIPQIYPIRHLSDEKDFGVLILDFCHWYCLALQHLSMLNVYIYL